MLSSQSRSTSVSASLLSLALAPLALIHSQDALAVDMNNECSAIYGSSFVPVTGKVAATSPTTSRPAKGKVFRDPNFKTCVVRATDHNADAGKSFTRNYYSRRQAFNADNSRYIVFANDNTWHLYDANTLTRLKTLSGLGSDAEAQWDPKDPRTLYYSRDTRLLKLDTESNTSTAVASFAGRLPWSDTAKVWTQYEGSPSADGRYWCFMAEASGGAIRGVFTYDLATQTVLGTRSLSKKPDHVSMSPSGRSCVIAGGDVSGATVSWNPTFTSSRTLYSTSAHSDIAVGADGSDNFIYVDYNNNGNLTVVNMDTGVRTALWSIYVNGTATSLHVSSKNFSKPGWFLLSTFNLRNGSQQWLHERVMAVEMKANPTIINLAHHQSFYNGYWTQPQASVSRDFSRVLFSSNWGTTSSTDVDAFMVRLPDNMLGGTTPAPAPTPTPTPTCTRAAPAVSLSGPTGSVAAGTTLSYTIGLTNRDSSACSPTTYSLARSIPSGWTGNLSTSSISLTAGASATATVSVTSASTAAAGNYSLGVGVGSSVGAAHTANASATYSVAAPTTAPPSTCARATPTVSVTGPTGAVAAGSTIKYTMTLRNNDSTCFAAKTFTLSRSVPSGWTGTLGSSTLKVAPGAAASTTLTVVSAGSAAGGTYGIGVGASSTVGSIHTASANTTYAVSAPTSAPAPTCARATPTVTLAGPTGAVAPGGTIKYTMTLRNNDSTCFAAKTFSLSRVVPSGWTGTLSASTLKVAPGASASTTLTVKSPTSAKTGSYSVRTNVSSTVGSIHTASATASYAIVK